jgi:pyruvate dehydrogenase E2 component (dihydrolipoamide acetyltransferase)
MLQSKQEIPCFYLNVKADVTDIVDLRTKLNDAAEVNISYNDFIIRALAAGLQKFPIMTGRLSDDTVTLAETIDVGLAVDTPAGVTVPVVKDVDKKDLTQIFRETSALIEKARANRLTPADLEGACITVSNLGAFGVDSFIPIAIPAQCSILGLGRIAETPIPDGRDVAIRKIISMTLSVDHRITNGAYAAQFLDFVRKFLEDCSNFA